VTVKHRIKALECRLIEAEIARMTRYYQSISYDELELICAIADDLQAGAMSREYSAQEVEFFNRHVETTNGFWDVAATEWTRRRVSELLTTGKATQAEIDEILDNRPLFTGPKVDNEKL